VRSIICLAARAVPRSGDVDERDAGHHGGDAEDLVESEALEAEQQPAG
jgi:hypothetical protein